SNRAVAVELRITVKAVENHVTAIFRKLELTERAELHQRVAAALTYVERTPCPAQEDGPRWCDLRGPPGVSNGT
ncbi:MAG: LuxR C-terminal-related transcriptional regulator, partial [Marmoricola sp.]